MTIARRLGDRDAIVAPAPDPTVSRPSRPRPDAPVPLGDVPAPEPVRPASRLRRCTYRRMEAVTPPPRPALGAVTRRTAVARRSAASQPQRATLTTYEVSCLLGGREEPLPLGDVVAARPVCEACRAPGIFRPDED